MFKSATKHPFGVKPRVLKGAGIHPMVKRSFRGKYLPHEGQKQAEKAQRLYMEANFPGSYDSATQSIVEFARVAPILQLHPAA